MTWEQLDAEAWAELRSLPKDLAIVVARHLVMAGRLLDEDPEQAYLHAKTARRLGSRVAIVREGSGIAAYQTGQWAEALAELRAARRLSGREAYLPVLADCERGLGRPERALSLARSAEAERLDQVDRVELRIVESGARRDMGQYGAAVLALQIPELKEQRLRPWSARLLYAYADALRAAGREDEAGEWFARAAAADRDGDTDAAEQYAVIEGLEIVDTDGSDDYLEIEEVDVDAAGQAVARDQAVDASPHDTATGASEDLAATTGSAVASEPEGGAPASAAGEPERDGAAAWDGQGAVPGAPGTDGQAGPAPLVGAEPDAANAREGESTESATPQPPRPDAPDAAEAREGGTGIPAAPQAAKPDDAGAATSGTSRGPDVPDEDVAGQTDEAVPETDVGEESTGEA